MEEVASSEPLLQDESPVRRDFVGTETLVLVNETTQRKDDLCLLQGQMFLLKTELIAVWKLFMF